MLDPLRVANDEANKQADSLTRQTSCRFARCSGSRLIRLRYLSSVGTNHTTHTFTYLAYAPGGCKRGWFIFSKPRANTAEQLGVSKKAADLRSILFLPPA